MIKLLFQNIMYQIKDFNVLIDGRPFFEIPVKNKEEAYEAIIKTSKNMIPLQVIYWIMNISKIITN